MPTNKHAIIRYQALDKCFRNWGKKYFIEDLVNACNQALFDLEGISDGIKKRQVYDDIRFMESESGYSADIERHADGRSKFYRYQDPSFTINKPELNEEEVGQLREVLSTLKSFKGLPQFDWMEQIATRFESILDLNPDQREIIGFEKNPFLSGLEFLTPLYNAILNKKVITVSYQSFKSGNESEFTVSPHYLKEYNNRWFLFGHHEGFEQPMNLALDRILTVKEMRQAYIEPKVDYEEYFEDVIGVSIHQDEAIVKVLLKFDVQTLPYVLSKPLHGSQKIKEVNGDKLIQIEVIPNYELESKLLAFGDRVKVIEPNALTERVKKRLKRAFQNYAD